jgi:hypothetical protein
VGIDPESIWSERGENYAAPRSEVEAVLANCQVEDFRPLWDRATSIKISWYLSRETGLRAWGAHAAITRLKIHWREAYTLKDFRQFRLAESWGRDQCKIDDELASDIAAHLMEIDSAGFVRWVENVRRLKPVSLNPVQGRYCCLFDRAPIPLQYWTFPAAAAYLRLVAKQQDGSDERRESDLLRKWAQRFDLKIAKPPIVRRFTPRGIEGFDLKAAQAHGLPLPEHGLPFL